MRPTRKRPPSATQFMQIVAVNTLSPSCLDDTYAPPHTHTHTHAHACSHTRTHTHARTHAHAHTHTHARVHTHTHTHKRTHAHARTHARTHAHTRTHTRVHTHACRSVGNALCLQTEPMQGRTCSNVQACFICVQLPKLGQTLLGCKHALKSPLILVAERGGPNSRVLNPVHFLLLTL